jgi:transketolase
MRKQLCDALVSRAHNPNMVFLTGDLGFMALEPLQSVMKDRFINAGVAEQNMISVAAALAKQNLEVWAYSIAPFIYARPFEQIRNDITFHNLPVKLIGNGGGYGYGVMGPTHHAIDDYGSLLTLPNMNVFVPSFDEDLESVIFRAGNSRSASYIRMGRGEPPKQYEVPAYAPWRQLTEGLGPVVIAVGPLAGIYIEAFNLQPVSQRPNLWAVCELPVKDCPPPIKILNQLSNGAALCVAEEHVKHGGFASDLLMYLVETNIYPAKFMHLFAKSHHFERYGSQGYLRQQAGLDSANMMMAIETLHHA